jgi:hypothetical protein
MAEETEVAAIKTAKTKSGRAISIQAWFTDKLGTTVGDRMFKEFVQFTADAAGSGPGSPGVLLDVRGGRVVSVHSAALE